MKVYLLGIIIFNLMILSILKISLYKFCDDDAYSNFVKRVSYEEQTLEFYWISWFVCWDTCNNLTKNLQILLFVYNQTNKFLLLSGVTATTTFASALSYAFQKNTYTFQHMAYDHQSAKKLTALAIFILFNLGFTAHEFDLWSKLMENKGEWY